MHEVLLEYSHVEFSERGVVVKLHLHLPSTIVDPFGTSKTWSSSSLTAGWGGGHSTQKSIFKSCVGSNFSEGKKHPKHSKMKSLWNLQKYRFGMVPICSENGRLVCLSSYYCVNLSTHPICIHLPILATKPAILALPPPQPQAQTTIPTTATARGKAVAATATALAAGCSLA